MVVFVHSYLRSQRKVERRTLFRRRLNPNAPAMSFNNLCGDRKSCSGPTAVFVLGVKTLEDLKYVLLVLFDDADSVITHGDDRRTLPVRRIDCAPNRNAFSVAIVVFDGIADQIRKNLGDLNAIAGDRRQIGQAFESCLRLVKPHADRIDRRSQNLVEIVFPHRQFGSTDL